HADVKVRRGLRGGRLREPDDGGYRRPRPNVGLHADPPWRFGTSWVARGELSLFLPGQARYRATAPGAGLERAKFSSLVLRSAALTAARLEGRPRAQTRPLWPSPDQVRGRLFETRRPHPEHPPSGSSRERRHPQKPASSFETHARKCAHAPQDEVGFRRTRSLLTMRADVEGRDAPQDEAEECGAVRPLLRRSRPRPRPRVRLRSP